MFSYDVGDIVRAYTDYEDFVGIVVERVPDVSRISGLDPGPGYEVRCVDPDSARYDAAVSGLSLRITVRERASSSGINMVFPQESVTLL